MAIKLSTTTAQLIPEGNYLFKVVAAEYNDKYGKLTIKFETMDSEPHYNIVEKFTLLSDKGAIREEVLKAASYFVRVILKDYNVQELDESTAAQMVNRYISGDIVHSTYTSPAGEKRTYAHIKNIASEVAPPKEPEENTQPQEDDDLGILDTL